MNYKIPQPEDNVAELREPAVAYYPGGRAAVEPWAVDVSDEPDSELLTVAGGGDWFDWMMENEPGFKDAVYRRLDETDAAIAAGEQEYTAEEVREAIDRCLETGNWSEILGDDA